MNERITRRAFLRAAAATTACAACATPLLAAPDKDTAKLATVRAHPAMFYEKLPDNWVKCTLCPRECEVQDGERGDCEVRENRGGEYYTLVWNSPCTAVPDPIEKKPLFHFLPGTLAFSIATAGCNIACKFCQNWNISQMRPEEVETFEAPADRIVAAAKRNNCASIAYTYSEPTIFYEYMHSCAAAGKEAGVRSVEISNGYIAEKPLAKLMEVVDAIKVDLKSFTGKFYRQTCDGELRPVLETIQRVHKKGVHLEIVVLLIPTLNDSKRELENMTRWISGEVGPDVPVHFTRFYPIYKMKNLPRTPVSSLERAYEVGKKAGLHFVYLGNVRGHDWENTFCPHCGATLIERRGYTVLSNIIKDGKCPKCGTAIPGVWS